MYTVYTDMIDPEFENIESFNWDDANVIKILKKHNLASSEVEEAFFNEPLIVYHDEVHSKNEERFYALGHTNSYKHIVIIFTIREKQIRPISARAMKKAEVKTYENFQENT